MRVVGFFEGEEGRVDLPRRDAAKGEEGGQFAAKVLSEEAVTCVFVGGSRAASEEVVQAFVGGGGATWKWMCRVRGVGV